MKYLVILFFFLSCTANASTPLFNKTKTTNEKHKKSCISKKPPKHKANFIKEEFCNYGKHGCNTVNIKETFEVLCDLDLVTQCYSKKAWLNRNQYFNLSNNVTVSNISTRTTFKSGVKTDVICAHYK